MLVTVPIIGGIGYLAAWSSSTYIWPRYAAYNERQRRQAAADRRKADYQASGDTLVGRVASGRIALYDPLAPLLTQYPPTDLLRFGEFVRLTYHDTGGTVELVGRDGRLVAAHRHVLGDRGRVVDRDVFIEFTAADRTACLNAWDKWMMGYRVLGRADVRAASIAAAGCAGVFDPDQWYSVAKPPAGPTEK